MLDDDEDSDDNLNDEDVENNDKQEIDNEDDNDRTVKDLSQRIWLHAADSGTPHTEVAK